MKLLITGGHPAPALAFIDEIITSNHQDIQLVFTGRKHTTDTSEVSYEYQEVAKRSVPFIHINAGRFNRMFSLTSFLQILKIPRGFFEAYSILRRERPDKIMSFGSYIALPLAVVGYCMKIPVYTHEQTIHPGLGNRIISRFAVKVFISFEDSKKYIAGKTILVSGNPVRKQIFKKIKDPFEIKKTRPVLYITGGSLGSHSINLHVKAILHDLLKKYIVIHQTGNVEEFKDYEMLAEYASHLPIDIRDYYYPVKHIFADEIGYVYSLADLVITRAGANTFFELVNLKKPAIFIPLPWSAHGEQESQAQLFRQWKTGEVFHQEGTSEELRELIENTMENIETYRHNFNTHYANTYQHAAAFILEEVLKD